MQRRLWLLHCLAFLSGVLLTTVACKKGPQVTVYVSDPARSGMEFYNFATKEGGFVEFPRTDKFVCLTPTDAETLFNYCSVNATH